MKRIIAGMLILALMLSFSACKESDEVFEAPANFYYLKEEIDYGAEDGVICSEKRESAHIQGDIAALLTQYLKGPDDPQLSRAVPAGVSVESVKTDGDQIILTLSWHFSRLNGIDLTLACSCLCMTILDYTQAQSVQFRVEGEFLGESESITMTRDDLLLMDELMIPEATN